MAAMRDELPRHGTTDTQNRRETPNHGGLAQLEREMAHT
jgi:hypothetical protein